MKKYQVVYHNADPDGWCSAAITGLYLVYQKGVNYKNINFFGYNYGDKTNVTLMKNKIVYFVDVSWEIDKMLKVKSIAKELTIIDHHKSFLDRAVQSDLKENLANSREGNCAAWLCWAWFHNRINRVVEYIDIMDLWKQDTFKWSDAEEFYTGIRTTDLHVLPATLSKWENLLFSQDEDYMKKLMITGRIIIDYESNQNRKRVEFVEEKNFEGLKFLVANVALTNAKFFYRYQNYKNFDAFCIYHKRGKVWQYSLSTWKDGVDILNIAKKYGGGGHPKACGFSSKKLLIK